MWRRACVAAVISIFQVGLALGLDFPYVAYVNSTDVYVRSGPGRDYYPTGKLQKGEQVEVYRHDPGGWLAVRPPRSSFSWVSSRHLDKLDDHLAVVNSERVVARVGSAFSDVRDVIQVRLDRDEKVELAEPPAADSPWCKISPPAGEFRWIFAKYVDHELPPDLVADQREAGADDRAGLSKGEDESDAQHNEALRAEVAGEVARLRGLEHIDMELSAIVAQDISQWSFDELRGRAQEALEPAQGPLERGRASVLLDKLARFDDIKRRHDALAKAPLRGAESATRVGADLRQARRAQDERFDGVGRLSPVVSQRTGGPQYALLDESGAVRSFVTPAPGVNLRPFVDKQIGVNGQRGYLTDLQRQHISVQRISLLETQRR